MLLKQEQAAQEKKSWAGGQYIEEHQGRWQIYVTWGNRNACSASGRGEADSCINGTRVPIRGKWGGVLWAHSPVLGLLCYGFGSPRMRLRCLWVHSRVGESRVVLKSWNQQMLGPELYASGTQDSASWWRVSPDGLCEGYGECQRRKQLSGLAGKKREGQETATRPKHYLYACVLRVYRFTCVILRVCHWYGIW